MKRYKFIAVMITDIIFFVFHWFCCNASIIANHKHMKNKEELFLSLFADNGGYEWRQSIMVIYIIPFLLGISFIMSYEEEIFNIIRLKSRRQFCKRYLFFVIIYSLWFSLLHEIVNVVGMALFFENKLIKDYNVLINSLINSIIIAIFYVKVGVVFQLYKIFTSSAVSNILTLLTYCTLYYSVYIFPVVEKINLPCYDCSIIYLLILNSVTVKSFFVILLRILLVLFALLLLYDYFYLKKDILKNERK